MVIDHNGIIFLSIVLILSVGLGKKSEETDISVTNKPTTVLVFLHIVAY